MIENMAVEVEVWPLAADKSGIWLLSGLGPWVPSVPVPADSSPHWEVDHLLNGHKAGTPIFIHSTSWRTEGPRVRLTYAAVLPVTEIVRAAWPKAQPIDSGALLRQVGPAASWTGSDSLQPRMLDVAIHAVRHIAFLSVTDQEIAQRLPQVWHDHLASATPALAGMYKTA